MGAKSRTKGATYEREVAKQIYDELGIKVSRNLAQYQCGGDDLRGLDGWSIECKRRAKALPNDVARWWMQTIEQADARSERPVLFIREDRQNTRAVIRLRDINPAYSKSVEDCVVVAFETWCLIVRETLN